MAKDRSEVNDALVNFSDIVMSIRSRTFSMRLPRTFRGILEGESGKDTSSERQKKKKKRGDQGKTEEEQITNEHQIKEFKIWPNEKWKEVFCGRLLEDRTDWDGEDSKMGPWWHFRGFCYNNCNNKAIHIKDDQVPGPKKVAYRGYLKEVERILRSGPSGTWPKREPPYPITLGTQSVPTLQNGNLAQ